MMLASSIIPVLHIYAIAFLLQNLTNFDTQRNGTMLPASTADTDGDMGLAFFAVVWQ